MFALLPPRSWRRQLTFVAACLVSAYALLGFVILPTIARPRLEAMVSSYAGKPVGIGSVSLNPFALSVALNDVVLDPDSEKPVVAFDELYGDVRALALLRMDVVLDAVRLAAPRVHLVIDKQGHLNLAALFASSEAPAEPPPAEAPAADEGLFPVSISSLTIDAGELLFRDEQPTPPFEIALAPVSLELKDFTTRRDQSGTYVLSARTGETSSLDWRGKISIDPLHAEGEITLEKIEARTLGEYLRQTLPFDVKGGTLGLKTAFLYDGKTSRFALGPGDVSADSLELRDGKDPSPFLTLKQLQITGAEIDFDKQHVKLGRVVSKQARATTWLDANGAMGPAALFGTGDSGGEPAPEGDAGWGVTIDEIDIGDYAVSFEDRSFTEPFVFAAEPITAKIGKLSLGAAEPSRIDVEIGLPDKGTIKFTGTAGFAPLAVDLDVKGDAIVLNRYQPYVGRAARIDLDSGSAGLDGKLKVHADEEGIAVVEFNGSAVVNDLSISETAAEEELVKWGSLSLNGISFQSRPRVFHVSEAVLDQPYARIAITKERKLNLGNLVIEPEGEAAPAEPATAQTPDTAVAIDVLKITDGSTDFADYSITPSVDTSIQDLIGEIEGLSSDPAAKSKVKLEGKVDKHAPVKISGVINPFNPMTQTDLLVSFQNVGLTVFTPYSARFAGYKIKKGKASVNLKYHIENRKLVAENHVVLDELTLGDRVEGPDATSLPVKLAVALLKDRHGRIELELPMRGELDDPKFSYGGILAKTLVDLIKKAVASPFSALGTIGNFSSEDLRSVDFAAGSAALDEEQGKKLDAIGQALKDRSDLRLEVTGAADAAADKVTLADAELIKVLKRAKRAEMKARGKEAPKKLSQIDLSADEYERFFTEKYKERFGAKPPRDENGAFTAAATSALADSLTIDESKLRALAQKRANAIQDRITAAGVEAERVFILEVDLDAKEEGGKVSSELSLSS